MFNFQSFSYYAVLKTRFIEGMGQRIAPFVLSTCSHTHTHTHTHTNTYKLKTHTHINVIIALCLSQVVVIMLGRCVSMARVSMMHLSAMSKFTQAHELTQTSTTRNTNTSTLAGTHKHRHKYMHMYVHSHNSYLWMEVISEEQSENVNVEEDTFKA